MFLLFVHIYFSEYLFGKTKTSLKSINSLKSLKLFGGGGHLKKKKKKKSSAFTKDETDEMCGCLLHILAWILEFREKKNWIKTNIWWIKVFLF